MEKTIIKEDILGARNLRNYLSSSILLLAGMGFFFAGLSSYTKKNFLPFTDTSKLLFYPQGIIMTFYGVAAITLSLYIIFTIYINFGGGYNEFSKKDQSVRIVRLGFPGKNRQIFLTFKFNNIKSLRFTVKSGINPRTNILLVLKDKREVPLFPSYIILKPSQMESKAIELANFLNLPLESSIF